MASAMSRGDSVKRNCGPTSTQRTASGLPGARKMGQARQQFSPALIQAHKVGRYFANSVERLLRLGAGERHEAQGSLPFIRPDALRRFIGPAQLCATPHISRRQAQIPGRQIHLARKPRPVRKAPRMLQPYCQQVPAKNPSAGPWTA